MSELEFEFKSGTLVKICVLFAAVIVAVVYMASYAPKAPDRSVECRKAQGTWTVIEMRSQVIQYCK